MNRRTRLVAIGAVASVLVACEVGPFGFEDWPDSRALTLVLDGNVTTVPDGVPVAGATIELVGGGVIGWFGGTGYVADSSVSDALGHYTLRIYCSDYVPRPACPNLEIVAHLDRFERGLEPQVKTLGSIQSTDSVASATLNFSLRPTRPITVAIHGRVTSGSSPLPVPGATIILSTAFWPFQSDTTMTDSLGTYRIADVYYCAMTNDSCLLGPLRLLAQQGSRGELRDLSASDVVQGDSLDLLEDFSM